MDREVRALLEKLTAGEFFVSISDKIIAWANKSETETDGRTLRHIIRLIVEKAAEEKGRNVTRSIVVPIPKVCDADQRQDDVSTREGLQPALVPLFQGLVLFSY